MKNDKEMSEMQKIFGIDYVDELETDLKDNIVRVLGMKETSFIKAQSFFLQNTVILSHTMSFVGEMKKAMPYGMMQLIFYVVISGWTTKDSKFNFS